MYTPMYDDTSIASRTAVHRTARAVPLCDVVVVTRARARTNATRERTNERTNEHGYFFLDDIVMTLTGTRASSSRPRVRARAFERMHSRGNAIRIFGDARERDAGDAETREGARGICGIFLGGRVRSRGRRRSRARGRRRAVDRTSTGRNVTGVDLRG